MTNDFQRRSRPASDSPPLPRMGSAAVAHPTGRPIGGTEIELAVDMGPLAPEPRFRVSSNTIGDVVVAGEIDVATVRQLDEQLDSWQATEGWELRSCDLSGVTFFSAAGVSWLIRRIAPIAPRGRVVISAEVRRILDLCELDLPGLTCADSFAA